MGKVTGHYVLCSVCKQGGYTLMKDGKDGYKHQQPAICAKNKSMRTQQRQRTILPTTAEVMKYARPLEVK